VPEKVDLMAHKNKKHKTRYAPILGIPVHKKEQQHQEEEQQQRHQHQLQVTVMVKTRYQVLTRQMRIVLVIQILHSPQV
jgi:hypothetical protein